MKFLNSSIMLRSSFVVLCSTILLTSLSAQDDGWILKKEVDGIEVYYRKQDDSKLNELKISTTASASLSTIVAALKDIPSFKEWIYKCDDAWELDPEPGFESSTYYYCVMDFPWPFKDRDFIAKSTLTQDPESMVITINSQGMPDYAPREKGNVRIEDMKVRWVITPTSAGTLEMDYYMKTDPGGNIPSWLINMGVDLGPVNTMRNLKDLMQQDKYRNTTLSYIVEAQNIKSKMRSSATFCFFIRTMSQPNCYLRTILLSQKICDELQESPGMPNRP